MPGDGYPGYREACNTPRLLAALWKLSVNFDYLHNGVFSFFFSLCVGGGMRLNYAAP